VGRLCGGGGITMTFLSEPFLITILHYAMSIVLESPCLANEPSAPDVIISPHTCRSRTHPLDVTTGSSWPLCIAMHNGHYVKFPFMYSHVDTSKMQSGLDAPISHTSFA
jgi:hypothetical protein